MELDNLAARHPEVVERLAAPVARLAEVSPARAAGSGRRVERLPMAQGGEQVSLSRTDRNENENENENENDPD